MPDYRGITVVEGSFGPYRGRGSQRQRVQCGGPERVSEVNNVGLGYEEQSAEGKDQ